MKSGLPQRIERHTGALVRHVEAREMPVGQREAAAAGAGAGGAAAGAGAGAGARSH